MPNDAPKSSSTTASSATGARKPLTAAAQRALAEAEERRQTAREAATPGSKEIDGRGGLDPVRYGDWEVNGLTSDF